MNEMEVHTMKCLECGKEMRDGYLFCSKDGAFSFANKVPGVFENAKNAEGFVKITELKPSHRTRVAASICEECKTVIFKYLQFNKEIMRQSYEIKRKAVIFFEKGGNRWLI